MSMFELLLAETNERLDRIEAALGITERTESGKVIDAMLAEEDALRAAAEAESPLVWPTPPDVAGDAGGTA